MIVALALCIFCVGIVCMPIDNRRVDALGESVEVAFDSNGGGAVAGTTVTVGDSYVLPVPNRSGYSFEGWYYGGQLVSTTGDSWNIAETQVTLVADWEIVTYTITYANAEGLNGGNPNPTNYNITDDITLQDVSKTGYVFNGWYDGVASKVERIQPGQKVGNLVLEASWTLITYNITYMNTFDVQNSNVATYDVEDEIILADLERDGYQFVGWYTNPENANTKVTTIAEGTVGDITLYAVWDVKQCTVKYASDEYPDVIVIFGDTLDELYVPMREGYEFVGWYSDSLYRNQFTENTVVNNDITLYAKWVKKTAPIWYFVSGGLALIAIIGAIVYMILAKRNKKDGYEF